MVKLKKDLKKSHDHHHQLTLYSIVVTCIVELITLAFKYINYLSFKGYCEMYLKIVKFIHFKYYNYNCFKKIIIIKEMILCHMQTSIVAPKVKNVMNF